MIHLLLHISDGIQFLLHIRNCIQLLTDFRNGIEFALHITDRTNLILHRIQRFRHGSQIAQCIHALLNLIEGSNSFLHTGNRI